MPYFTRAAKKGGARWGTCMVNFLNLATPAPTFGPLRPTFAPPYSKGGAQINLAFSGFFERQPHLSHLLRV